MINRFSSFPTEKVKIIKASGLIIDNVDAFMSNNMFLIEDGRLDIEENDIISRSLPNGKTEEYLVIDRGFKRTIGSFPDHYQVIVKKQICNVTTKNKHSQMLSFKDKAIMEKLFYMGTGYVLNLNNSQFRALIAECSDIDVYSNPNYISESSKAKKLRKFWNNENDIVVGKVILELLGVREAIIKSRIEYDSDYNDTLADEALRIKGIAMSMIGDTPLFSSTAERFQADLSAANAVLQDLIKIGECLCTNVAYNEKTDEDTMNTFFRDMLCFKGYEETKDQTRHGLSQSGKGAGEVDLLLTKAGKEIALFEGLKLNGVRSQYIDDHIEKAINNYNALGTATFVVAYVSCSDFGDFWNRYYEHLENYKYGINVKRNIIELTAPNASTKIAQIILSRAEFDFPVYYICFKIS